jgi:hypothetical protein
MDALLWQRGVWRLLAVLVKMDALLWQRGVWSLLAVLV